MEIKEYQKRSTRTLNKELFTKEQLMNMALGISGESGEIADIFKKVLFQGHDLKIEDVIGELGDVMFYIVNLCTLLEIDIRFVLEYNVDKLQKRYPEGFDSNRSINRGNERWINTKMY